MKDTKLNTVDLNLIYEQYGQMYNAPIEEAHEDIPMRPEGESIDDHPGLPKGEQPDLPGIDPAIKQRAATRKDPEVAHKVMLHLGNRLLADPIARQRVMQILGDVMPELSDDGLKGAAGQLIAGVKILKRYEVQQREERAKAQQIAQVAQSTPRNNPYQDDDLPPSPEDKGPYVT